MRLRPGGRLILASAALIGLLLPEPADAQSRRPGARSRADIRASRTNALAPPEQPAAGAGIAPVDPADAPSAADPVPDTFFALDLLAPLLFNSNAEQFRTRGTAALEATPEARLGFSRRYPGVPMRLGAVADASTDRFGRVPRADTDQVFARLRAQFESGTNDQQAQPFLVWQPTFIDTHSDPRLRETRHDLAIGIDKQFNFGAGWRRVPPSPDSSGETVWSLGINASLQRRWRQPEPGSLALLVNPSITYVHAPWLSASLEVDITRRWFDRTGDSGRRDWLVIPVLTVEFIPPAARNGGGWLGSPVLAFQAYFARQASSQPEDRFAQWGAGPVLRTSWRF